MSTFAEPRRWIGVNLDVEHPITPLFERAWQANKSPGNLAACLKELATVAVECAWGRYRAKQMTYRGANRGDWRQGEPEPAAIMARSEAWDIRMLLEFAANVQMIKTECEQAAERQLRDVELRETTALLALTEPAHDARCRNWVKNIGRFIRANVDSFPADIIRPLLNDSWMTDDRDVEQHLTPYCSVASHNNIQTATSIPRGEEPGRVVGHWMTRCGGCDGAGNTAQFVHAAGEGSLIWTKTT